MKKLLTLMLAAAAMISFTACEKDGAENRKSEFTVGTSTYELTHSCCYPKSRVSNDLQYTRYDIYLTNGKFWDNTGEWTDESIYATANMVNLYYLYALTSTQEVIQSGTYKYSDEPGHLTFNSGPEYCVNDKWHDFSHEGNPGSNVEITITHISDNVYEIIFTGGRDENGNAISGYYKGAVDFYRPK